MSSRRIGEFPSRPGVAFDAGLMTFFRASDFGRDRLRAVIRATRSDLRGAFAVT